jgi:hypothetical protein
MQRSRMESMLPARDTSKDVPGGLHIKHRGRDERTVVLTVAQGFIDFHGDFRYKSDDSWFPPLQRLQQQSA